MTTQTSEVKVVNQDGNVALEIIDTPKIDNSVTEENLAEQGLDPREIELAKKNNLVSEPKKTEENKENGKKMQGKEEKGQKIETKKEEIKEEAEKDMSVEEEYEYLKNLNKNERGLYGEAKKQRKKRQAAELERDYIKTRVKALEEQLEFVKNQKEKEPENVPYETDNLSDDKTEEYSDPFSSLKDDDIITVADFKKAKKLEEEQAKKRLEKEQAKNNAERAKYLEIDKKLMEIEIGARQRYSDFDETMKLSQEILKDPKKVFGDDKKKMNKAIALAKAVIADMQNAINNPDPEYNVADLSYELGQLHPKYKIVSDEDNTETMSEEKVERIVKNSEKRKSSAGLTGSKRIVSVNEITLEDVVNMSQDEYNKLPKDVRERLLGKK